MVEAAAPAADHPRPATRTGGRPRLRAITLAALCAACAPGQPPPDPAIAAAVALQLDSLYGFPSVIVAGFWCDLRHEECVPGVEGPTLSPIDGTDFARAFAEARGIPVAERIGFQAPVCRPLAEAPDSGGLYAQFVQPPAMYGDSATVELATGCSELGTYFEQIHFFVLRREGRGWVVVRRELSSMT